MYVSATMEAKLSNQTKTCSSIVKLVCVVYSTALMNLLSLPFFACLLAHTALKTSSELNLTWNFILFSKDLFICFYFLLTYYLD